MRNVGAFIVVSCLTGLVTAVGCGSSSSSGTGGSTTGSSSSGSPTTSSSSSGTASTSSSSSSSGAGTGGGSTTCTAPTTVTGVPAYTSVTHQSACSKAEVAAFITACDSATATNTTCSTWASAAGNAACSACIQPANNAVTGATYYDNQMNAYTNYAGCVQLTDGNTTCAAPFSQLQICLDDACNSAACEAATDAEFNACETAAQSGACAADQTAAATCNTDLADGGDLSTGACSTDSDVIYVICGNGT